MSQKVNGLFKTEHLVAALRTFGPMTRNQLWKRIENISGIQTRGELKKHLLFLKEHNRVSNFADKNKLPGQRLVTYIWKHNPGHKLNKFDIPAGWATPVSSSSSSSPSSAPQQSNASSQQS